MSSGIEILLLAPLLFPGIIGAGVTSAGLAAGSTTAASGSVLVSGGSIITTGGFATGGATAAGGTAAGGAATGMAGGAAVAGSVILVVGSAAAALLAARYLQSSYENALSSYQQRLDAEKTPIYAANQAHQEAMRAALVKAGKTRVKAAESAELAFLRAGVQKLQKRVSDWPGIDPRVPGACARLLADLESPAPDTAALFAAYESLGDLAAKAVARQRETALAALAAKDDAAGLKNVVAALQADVAELQQDITQAPRAVLADEMRVELKRSLLQVQALTTAQPRLAHQGLQLLRGRIGRELSLGAEREAKLRQEQAPAAASLRELAGRISARSQATMAVLQDEELVSSPLARAQISGLQARAVGHLERLATLLAGAMPANLVPLETLAGEADALFDETGQQLLNLAQQIYLQDQVAEVFTQLGYQVTTTGDQAAGQSAIMATVNNEHGVEVRLDGAGNLSSEMVAFSAAATEIEPQAQERVCALMDEVFDLLQARGCTVREKKRRHAKKGERSLRVVKSPKKKSAPGVTQAAPVARRLGE